MASFCVRMTLHCRGTPSQLIVSPGLLSLIREMIFPWCHHAAREAAFDEESYQGVMPDKQLWEARQGRDITHTVIPKQLGNKITAEKNNLQL